MELHQFVRIIYFPTRIFFLWTTMYLLTEPQTIVLALAVFQFGLDHCILVSVRRQLQQEGLDSSTQRINHLPSDEKNDIHRQQSAQHNVQLPWLNLLLYRRNFLFSRQWLKGIENRLKIRDIQMREQQTMQDGSIFMKKLKISLITNEENEEEKRYDCKSLTKKGY